MLLYIPFKQRRHDLHRCDIPEYPCIVLRTSQVFKIVTFCSLFSFYSLKKYKTEPELTIMCFFNVYRNFQYHADTVVFMKEISKHMYDNGVVIYDKLHLQLKSLAK